MSTRGSRPFVVYGFKTTHDALAAEAALREGGVDVVPVPTPRSLGTSCGLAMRVSPDATEQAEGILASNGIPVVGHVGVQDV